MKPGNIPLPLTVAEQAKLLGVTKSDAICYQKGLHVVAGGRQERLNRLYTTWGEICKSQPPLFPLIDTLHTKIQARHWLQQQQTMARHKCGLLQAKLERMRCFFRPVPDKLILVQRLLKEGDTTVYDLPQLKRMEIRLVHLTDLYGPVRQELVKYEIALAAYTERLVTETLKQLHWGE